MGKKVALTILFIILLLLLSFFGLGPVLMADGMMGERLLTLLIVILLYILLIVGFIYINRRINK